MESKIDVCVFCGRPGYKTNGRAELICYNRANTGNCDKEPEIFRSQAPVVRDAPKVGRNDKCPCGSGVKYKNCCLLK